MAAIDADVDAKVADEMDGSPLPDLQSVSDEAKKQLFEMVSKVDGPKDMVIQRELMSLLEHVTPLSFLRKIDVDKIFRLEPTMTAGGENRFYVIRPEMLAASQVAEHIISDMRRGEPRKYHVIFVPRKLATCEYVLEREGVFGLVTILEWSKLLLIPLDEHLLSLERHDFPQALFLNGDLTMLQSVAQSILLLEQVYGQIPIVRGKGELAESVWALVKRLREQERSDRPSSNPAIDELVLIDRRCDLVTPLFSQLTYEGILDDTFKIKSGFVEFGRDITKKDQGAKVLLNSKDPVYATIRSQFFSDVPGVLSTMSKELRSSYDRGRGEDRSISELRQFVKRLPDLRKKHDSLAVHLNASEEVLKKKKHEELQRQLFFERAILEAVDKGVDKVAVIDFIEECIHRQVNLRIPLRLLCLLSTTNDGVKSKYLKPLKQQYLHSYGHRHILSFHQLDKVGLLREKPEDIPVTAKSKFKQLSKVLGLVPDLPKDTRVKDIFTTKDTSYVYGGAYCPLSCAVVEHFVRSNNWSKLDALGGPTISEPPERILEKPRVVLVYFIGGCTFSEMNALQLLEEKSNIRYIVATTNIINAASFIDCFVASKD